MREGITVEVSAADRARLEAVVGESLAVEHVESRPGDVRHSTADGSKLQALFPDVEPVDLDEGLRATVDWFRSST